MSVWEQKLMKEEIIIKMKSINGISYVQCREYKLQGPFQS